LQADLGRLGRCSGSPKFSFCVNHSDPSSAIPQPLNVPCAQFRTLNCSLDFRPNPRQSRANGDADTARQESVRVTIPICKPRTKRLRSRGKGAAPYWRTEIEGASHPVLGVGEVPRFPSRAHSLAAPTRTEIRDVHNPLEGGQSQRGLARTESHLDTPVPPGRSLSGRSHSDSCLTSSSQGVTIDSRDILLLIKVALHKLLGVKRRIGGVRILKASTSPSLIDIAPAVWNLRYLRVR
jgi:hypothetical protein